MLSFPSSLSNLLEPGVFDGQVLSRDLIAGEVKLSGGEAVPSDAAVEVCDGAASVPEVSLSPSGSILLSSSSSSRMALSTEQFEFGFAWSPRTITIPLSTSCGSGLEERDWSARARSVLTSTLAACRMGVTVVRMALIMSSLDSDSARVAVVKLENLSQVRTTFWEALFITSVFMCEPGWSILEVGENSFSSLGNLLLAMQREHSSDMVLQSP